MTTDPSNAVVDSSIRAYSQALASRSLEGVGVDTIYLRIDLADGPDRLREVPKLAGWDDSPSSLDFAWCLKHKTLKQAWMGLQKSSGALHLRLSIAELGSALGGQKGNLAKVTPADMRDFLATLLEDLEDALEVPGLPTCVEITRLDVCADIVTEDPGLALATFRDKSAVVARRAKQEGWSFEVQKTPHSITIPRRAPKVGRSDINTTEPSRFYNKGKKHKRADLEGLVRMEAVHGQGHHYTCFVPGSKTPMDVLSACSGKLWRSLLQERLRELGLTHDVRIKNTASVHQAANLLVADGINDAQAALYALASLDPTGSLKMSPRAIRRNKQLVESRTNIRLSSTPTAPRFVADLWKLIEGAQLPDPQGPPCYRDDAAELLGLRPRAPAATDYLDEVEFQLSPTSITLEPLQVLRPPADDPEEVDPIGAPANNRQVDLPILDSLQVLDIDPAPPGHGIDSDHQERVDDPQPTVRLPQEPQEGKCTLESTLPTPPASPTATAHGSMESDPGACRGAGEGPSRGKQGAIVHQRNRRGCVEGVSQHTRGEPKRSRIDALYGADGGPAMGDPLVLDLDLPDLTPAQALAFLQSLRTKRVAR